MNPWKMEARALTFEPSMKTLIPPRTRWPTRSACIRRPHPLPDDAGRLRSERRAQPAEPRPSASTSASPGKRRSTSSPARWSASRRRTARPPCSTSATSTARTRSCKPVTAPAAKLLRKWGGFTLQIRQPDSWEGWWWGSKHFWGCEPVGQGKQSNLLYDIAKNTELLLFWAATRRLRRGAGRVSSEPPQLLVERDRHQSRSTWCPDLNYAAAVHADRWIPVLPNHRRRRLPGHHASVVQGRHLRQGLPETHAVGVEKYEAYVMGEEDGVPKDAGVAAPITGIPARVLRALAKEWASKRTNSGHRQRRPGIRGPYATEPARLQGICLAMQGLGSRAPTRPR